MDRNKLHRALKYMAEWQAKAVSAYINMLEKEIQDYIGIVTCSIEEIKKYKILASFIGFNRRNINTMSLESLEFLSEHRKEAKYKFNFETLYSTLSAYDLYVLMNQKKPKKLEDLKELTLLLIEAKNSSFKDLDTINERLKNGK